ncbi:MAG TPA: XrtA system polysaccharide deacetylase [Phycisphaerae bacterium]|nr:XrtA system polysaccharide deacetylase [Phycisphaerae bacterium]
MTSIDRTKASGVLTVDVEDWFHILDSPATPPVDVWEEMEPRVERNTKRLLELFDATGTRATFFWLGWVAERHVALVRACQEAGHEIASHGYAHVLAYGVGPEAFRQDVMRAKGILENITGQAVPGFRVAGFSITAETEWAYDVIREAGHEYDSSVFPASRGHGGIPGAPTKPYVIETRAGPLVEIPMSVVSMLGFRFSLFGGGYLRLAQKWLIRWGINRLHAADEPLIIYVHPREVDPGHPRLPLSLKRRFKCYVNLKSTIPKLEWLCREYKFCTMHELAEQVLHFHDPQRAYVS